MSSQKMLCWWFPEMPIVFTLWPGGTGNRNQTVGSTPEEECQSVIVPAGERTLLNPARGWLFACVSPGIWTPPSGLNGLAS